jgi:hypothetical protein
MTPRSTNRFATLISGMALIIPASIGLGLVSSGPSPSLISPLPVLTILPAFVLGGLFKAAVVLPTLLFLAWNPNLLRGEAKVPRRSYLLLLTAIALSAAYFKASWNWGIEYQGVRYVHTVCAINLACAGVLGLAFAWSWKREHHSGQIYFCTGFFSLG